jgi:hypothetical protein
MTSRPQQARWILYLHEVLFSLNVGIAGSDGVCLYWHRLEDFFYFRVEHSILRRLHIIHLIQLPYGSKRFVEQPHFTSGYIAFWMPALALALCVWALLRVSSHARLTTEIRRSVAGFVALFLLPGLWLIGSMPTPSYLPWVVESIRQLLSGGRAIELSVAVFCALLYLRGKWPITTWRTAVLLALHFIYWFYMVYPFPYSARSVPIIVSLCSSLVWGAYIRSVRQDDRLVNLPA